MEEFVFEAAYQISLSFLSIGVIGTITLGFIGMCGDWLERVGNRLFEV